MYRGGDGVLIAGVSVMRCDEALSHLFVTHEAVSKGSAPFHWVTWRAVSPFSRKTRSSSVFNTFSLSVGFYFNCRAKIVLSRSDSPTRAAAGLVSYQHLLQFAWHQWVYRVNKQDSSRPADYQLLKKLVIQRRTLNSYQKIIVSTFALCRGC